MQGVISRWNIGNAILAAGPVAHGILITLLVVSVIALAIFINKLREYRRIHIHNDNFMKAFHKKSSLDDFYKNTPANVGPFFRIFEAGYSAMKSNLTATKEMKEVTLGSAIDYTLVQEKHKVEGQLVFLATTAIITPFIGLFGTVWGILNSFMDIQAYGSAHINVVAPGIAEALVTTAAGLCVAIPAVIFYNYLLSRTNKFSDEFDAFAKSLLNELRLSL
jgi:biopolymer transport protein TolQ